MCESLIFDLFVWFFGGWDGLMLVLVAFVVVEALFSVLLAISGKKAQKNVKGWLAKQTAMFLVVGIANLTDCYLSSGEGNAFRTIIILFYVGCKSSEILKMAQAMNVPVPQKFFKFLIDLCDGEE